jgi:hypothetical protein
MRKFAVTSFAVCYALFLVFVSAERTAEWAVKEADSLVQFHHVDHGSKNVGKGGKSDSHLQQTRLIETGFVVELPREAAASPIPTQRLVHCPTFGLYLSRSTRLIPSRAPPALS